MALGLSSFVRVGLIVAGLVVVILLVGMLQNMLILPLVNTHWVKQGSAAADEEDVPGATQPIRVIVPCYGHPQDTAIQVTKILKMSRCPLRVTVVVVSYGPSHAAGLTTTERERTVLQRLTHSPAFRGIADSFCLADHVMEVAGGAEPMGDYVALADGLQALRDHAMSMDTLCFMGAQTAALPHWDEVMMRELFSLRAPGAAVLSYHVTSETMHNVSFPVVSANNQYPLLAWGQFHTAPMAPHPARFISSTFLAITLPEPNRQVPLLIKTLSQQPCHPVASDLLLTLFLRQSLNLQLYHPTRLIVTGRGSTNYSRMYSLQRKTDTPQHQSNKMSTQQALTWIRKHDRALDINLGASAREGGGASYESLMGLLPRGTAGQHELEEDVRIKYGSAALCAKMWKSVQRRCRVAGQAPHRQLPATATR